MRGRDAAFGGDELQGQPLAQGFLLLCNRFQPRIRTGKLGFKPPQRPAKRAGIADQAVVTREPIHRREHARRPYRKHRRDRFGIGFKRLIQPRIIEPEGAIAIERKAQIAKRARRARGSTRHHHLARQLRQIAAQFACARIIAQLAADRRGQFIDLRDDIIERRDEIIHHRRNRSSVAGKAEAGRRADIGGGKIEGEPAGQPGDAVGGAGDFDRIEQEHRIARGRAQLARIAGRLPRQKRQITRPAERQGVGARRFEHKAAGRAFCAFQHQLRAARSLRDIGADRAPAGLIDLVGDGAQGIIGGDINGQRIARAIDGKPGPGNRAEPDGQRAFAHQRITAGIAFRHQRLRLGKLGHFEREIAARA